MNYDVLVSKSYLKSMLDQIKDMSDDAKVMISSHELYGGTIETTAVCLDQKLGRLLTIQFRE